MLNNNMEQADHYKWVFWGTSQIAVHFLEYLYTEHNLAPQLIICNPDKPTGRKQTITPSPVKRFALKHDIPYLQPTNPKDCLEQLQGYDFFLVFAYGSILPQSILELPTHGVLNIHPSLLPQYRGPSPITTAILRDTKDTGVSIIKLTEQMDAGDIVAQIAWPIKEWKKYYVHEKEAAIIGAQLFYENIADYMANPAMITPQDEKQASYCPKYSKADMKIDLQAPAYEQYRTYCAFVKPFFVSHKRFVVTLAHLDHQGEFVIDRVIPEGKQERELQANDTKLDKTN